MNDIPRNWKRHPEEFVKLVHSNTDKYKCSLDAAGNIILNNVDDVTVIENANNVSKLEHSDVIKAVITIIER